MKIKIELHREEVSKKYFNFQVNYKLVSNRHLIKSLLVRGGHVCMRHFYNCILVVLHSLKQELHINIF